MFYIYAIVFFVILISCVLYIKSKKNETKCQEENAMGSYQKMEKEFEKWKKKQEKEKRELDEITEKFNEKLKQNGTKLQKWMDEINSKR